MATALCRHCGKQDVAYDAGCCSRCHGSWPHPVRARNESRTTWYALAGAGMGAAVGALFAPQYIALGGMEQFVGLFVGCGVGAFIGSVASLFVGAASSRA